MAQKKKNLNRCDLKITLCYTELIIKIELSSYFELPVKIGSFFFNLAIFFQFFSLSKKEHFRVTKKKKKKKYRQPSRAFDKFCLFNAFEKKKKNGHSQYN